VLRSSDGREGQLKNAVPEQVSRVADVMAKFPAPWALAGGWAVDAWLGRVTREHGDVDIAVFDQQALYKHLAGWQLIAHQDGKENQGVADLWDGRPLVPPAHAHGRSPEESGPLPERFDEAGNRIVFPEDGFWFDAPFCERSGGDWVLNAEPRVTLPLAECIRQSALGLPTVAPEVILFFKATLYVGTKNHLRPTDEADFVALLPLLTDGQCESLREMVSRVYDGEHPWVGRM
jgi:hypothetical protein